MSVGWSDDGDDNVLGGGKYDDCGGVKSVDWSDDIDCDDGEHVEWSNDDDWGIVWWVVCDELIFIGMLGE